MLGGVRPNHSVRGHRRKGLQNGAAAVHRARHDSDWRVLLCGAHNAVLLSARVLFYAAPAQGHQRQDGRVLQVHAVPEPSDETCRHGAAFRRRGHGHRRRRGRANDDSKTCAEARADGRSSTGEIINYTL